MLNGLEILWAGTVGMFVLMTLLYIVHLRTRDAGLADLGWTAGVGFFAIALAILGEGWVPRRLVVGAMVALWSGRLFAHILKDRIVGKEEDARYRALRHHWGRKANRNFFFVFQAQTVLAVIFSIPILVLTGISASGFGLWELIGIAIFLISLAGESLADRQLAHFRSDPNNREIVCSTGLWHYSRHPNYFFEWLHWCAYVLMGIGHPSGWLTLIGPVVMWVFIRNITGIPYTEKRSLASKGDAYKKYQQTTNAFFPWFPKNST